MTKAEILDRVRRAVNAANGRGRARLVEPDDVAEAVVDAARGVGDWADNDPAHPTRVFWTSLRERVPSSYTYAAYATAADVVRYEDVIYVLVDRKRAGASTPLRLSEIQESRWKPETIRRRLDQAVELAKARGALVLRVADVLAEAEAEAVA